MDKANLSYIEGEVAAHRYTSKVTVNASGETTVKLSNLAGHSFEGKAKPFTGDGYAKALVIAANRMLAYERRFDKQPTPLPFRV